MSANLPKAERRAAILDAAVNLAKRKNYTTLTATDVSNAAGCAKGLVFHYFKNMRGLRVEILRKAVAAGHLTIIAHGLVADDPVIRQISKETKNAALASLTP